MRDLSRGDEQRRERGHHESQPQVNRMIRRIMADLPEFDDPVWCMYSAGSVPPRYHTYVSVEKNPFADLPVPPSALR